MNTNNIIFINIYYIDYQLYKTVIAILAKSLVYIKYFVREVILIIRTLFFCYNRILNLAYFKFKLIL